MKYSPIDKVSESAEGVIVHLNSYECALHDVETLLKNRGVTV